MKLTHLALWTSDLEDSARFWTEYFDARIGEAYVSRNRPGFRSRFVTLPENDVRIELMEGPWVKPYPGEVCGWAHIAYSVGSVKAVDEMAARFAASGLLVSQPRRTGDGYYEAVVRSPEGVLIEIVE
jgi:lactoylglutathione lyase